MTLFEKAGVSNLSSSSKDPANLGLFGSITAGVSKLCDAKGRAIVIEDDIAVAPQFLTYMNRALDQYANDERVYQVSGYSYPGDFSAAGDAYFLPDDLYAGAGASWARSWSKFDPSLKRSGSDQTGSAASACVQYRRRV